MSEDGQYKTIVIFKDDYKSLQAFRDTHLAKEKASLLRDEVFIREKMDLELFKATDIERYMTDYLCGEGDFHVDNLECVGEIQLDPSVS